MTISRTRTTQAVSLSDYRVRVESAWRVISSKPLSELPNVDYWIQHGYELQIKSSILVLTLEAVCNKYNPDSHLKYLEE